MVVFAKPDLYNAFILMNTHYEEAVYCHIRPGEIFFLYSEASRQGGEK